jgi:hypothetical protein
MRDPNFQLEVEAAPVVGPVGSLDDLAVSPRVGVPRCGEADMARFLPLATVLTRAAGIVLVIWASFEAVSSVAGLILYQATSFVSFAEFDAFPGFARSVDQAQIASVVTRVVLLIACTFVLRKVDGIARWLVRAAR